MTNEGLKFGALALGIALVIVDYRPSSKTPQRQI